MYIIVCPVFGYYIIYSSITPWYLQLFLILRDWDSVRMAEQLDIKCIVYHCLQHCFSDHVIVVSCIGRANCLTQ